MISNNGLDGKGIAEAVQNVPLVEGGAAQIKL